MEDKELTTWRSGHCGHQTGGGKGRRWRFKRGGGRGGGTPE